MIQDYAFTITTRQDRTPAQVIDCGGGRYRYLTERECWRLQGYTDEEFEAAKAVQKRVGRYRMALYKQAGNSIAVPILKAYSENNTKRNGIAQTKGSERMIGKSQFKKQPQCCTYHSNSSESECKNVFFR